MRILLAMACFAALAAAADPFYIGTWKITSARVAPWQSGPPYASDLSETKSLVGKTIFIQSRRIAGPGILACRAPDYRVRDYPAGMLFQGGFDEMHRRNPSADPAKLAAGLGFHGNSWKTLETGCANELDFHFLNPSTAAFALNNYIYTLKKQ